MIVSASQVESGCDAQRDGRGRTGVEERAAQELLGFLPGVLSGPPSMP